MKEIYVRDLRPNQMIVSEFLVHTKEVRLKKSGENYLSLTLADKTGEVWFCGCKASKKGPLCDGSHKAL